MKLLNYFFIVLCMVLYAIPSNANSYKYGGHTAIVHAGGVAPHNVGYHAGNGYHNINHGVGYHGGYHHEFHHFGAHDWHHMSAYDRRMWRGGRWRHEWYNGQYGYWWFVGGAWYFYGAVAPVSLYPEVVVEPTIIAEPTPTVQVVTPTPRIVVQPQVKMKYYCSDPPGYAPYVQNCNSAWQSVPVH